MCRDVGRSDPCGLGCRACRRDTKCQGGQKLMWSPDPQAIGMRVEDLDTPVLLLDLDRVETNLAVMAQALEGTAVRLRPHAKTHKSPVLARMQIERGAV